MRFLTQLDADSTSYGVWRAGPQDEIFGRYGRVVVTNKSNSNAGRLSFIVTDEVFQSTPAAYARIVYLNEGPGRTWSLRYSTDKGECASAGFVTNGVGNQSTIGHWVEARFLLDNAQLGSGRGPCDGGADVSIVDMDSGPELFDSFSHRSPTVFNLVDISKEEFGFALSPWTQDVEQ